MPTEGLRSRAGALAQVGLDRAPRWHAGRSVVPLELHGPLRSSGTTWRATPPASPCPLTGNPNYGHGGSSFVVCHRGPPLMPCAGHQGSSWLFAKLCVPVADPFCRPITTVLPARQTLLFSPLPFSDARTAAQSGSLAMFAIPGSALSAATVCRVGG